MYETILAIPLFIGLIAAIAIYAFKRNIFNNAMLASVIIGIAAALILDKSSYPFYFVGLSAIGFAAGYTLISAYDLIYLPLTGKVKDFGQCDFIYGQIVFSKTAYTNHSSTTISSGVFGNLQANSETYTNEHAFKAIKTPIGEIIRRSELNEITNASNGDYVIYAGGKGDRQVGFFNITKQESSVTRPPKTSSIIGATVIYSIPYIGTAIAFGGVVMAYLYNFKSNRILDTGAMPRDRGHYIFAFIYHILIVIAALKYMAGSQLGIGDQAFRLIALLAAANILHFAAWYMDYRQFIRHIESSVKKIISEQHMPMMKKMNSEQAATA